LLTRRWAWMGPSTSGRAMAGPRVLLGLLAWCMLWLVPFAGGCGDGTSGDGAGGDDPTEGRGASDLFVASTTSLQDCGLFEVLLPAFERAHPEYTVKVVAVGSGEALRLGETGDVDVLLVHSPEAELDYMRRGLGLDRRPVMSSDFVIVGPPSDPAAIKGLTDAAAALARVAATRSLFFSRGDGSGTHAKEREIWQKAGLVPSGDWYQTTGQGMGETLTITAQKGGYTLTDRATYLAKRESLALAILVEGGPGLRNPYHVMTVKDAREPVGAALFLTWLTGEEAQRLIRDFGREQFGEPLFLPEADKAPDKAQ